MSRRISKKDEEKFVQALLLSKTMDKNEAYTAIRPKVIGAALYMGSKRMMLRPRVIQLLEDNQDNIRAITPIETNESLVTRIDVSQLDVINLFAHAALIDPKDYYNDDGTCKKLNELTLDQRRNIRDIQWGIPDKVNGAKRIPVKYTLCDQDKNKEQLAKIMGLSGPQFDFAGFLALITGKTQDEAEDDIKRLNHADGCQFDKIVKAIEGECTEIDTHTPEQLS